MAQPYATFNFLDHSGERSKLSVFLPDVTPANLDDTINALLDIRTALAAVSLCTIGATPELVGEVHTETVTLPASPYAQRERRAMFNCIDSSTSRPFKIGVPCADMTDMAQSGTDAINLTNVEVAAYLVALGTYAASPEGNTFSVVGGKVTGVPN